MPAGYYKLKAVIADGGNNYNGVTFVTEEAAFTVAKASASITVGSQSFQTEYTGKQIFIADIVAGKISEQHGIKLTYWLNGVMVDSLTDVRDTPYTIVIKLDETDANYNNYTLENDVGITITITPKKIVITDLTVPTWEYNVNAKPDPKYGTNIPNADKDDVVFTFKYYKNNGEYLGDEVTPTDAGWYYVVVTATLKNGNTNLTASDEATSPNFQITAKPITLSGVTNGETIERDYNGDNYKTTFENKIKNANPDFASKLVFTYTKVGVDGAYEGNIQNQGTYGVTISLADTETNHSLVPVTLSIVIYPIENSQSVSVADSITFGDKVLEKIILPEDVQGSWSLKIGGTTVDTNATFDDAGTQTFVAVFTPDSYGNYCKREVEVSVTVNPANGELKNGDNVMADETDLGKKSYTSNGYDIGALLPNLGWNHAESASISAAYYKKNAQGVYELLQNATKISDVGEYMIEISLSASNNYDGDSATVYVEIIKANVTFEDDFSITGWEYGQYNATTNKASVTATVNGNEIDAGEITFKYYTDGAGENEITTALNALPKGTYYVRAVVNQTNYAGTSNVLGSFEVEAHEVELPQSAQSSEFTYNGSIRKPNIAASTYYDIEWSNANSTNVGSYTVTLKLKDTTNTTWSDGTVANKQYPYTITKADVVITVTAPETTYNGSAYNLATIKVTLSGTEVTLASVSGTKQYYYKDANGDWVLTGNNGADVPVNAGDYKIVVTVGANTFVNELIGATVTNYDGATKSAEFTIEKAATTITTVPSFVNGTFYQNRFAPGTTNAANGAVTSVPGTWSFGTPVFTAGTATSCEVEVTYTFTPTDTTNYTTIKSTDTGATKYTITLVAVAKFGDTYYGTVEGALDAANLTTDGGTVLVLPYDKNVDDAIYITRAEVNINSNVTLLLPYASADGTTGQNTYTDGLIDVTMHYNNANCDNAAHNHNYPSNTNTVLNDTSFCNDYCFVKVIIADGVTIHNRGTLEVAGELSGGSGDNKFAGYTAGLHARLMLGSGATIISYDKSIIRAAGYIRNVDEANPGQVTIKSGAKLYQPFVMMDYYSGQYLAGPYKTLLDGKGNPVNPFNKFGMINVSPTVRVEYGGTVIGWASLYTTSTKNNNTAEMIYVGQGGVIELSENAYLIAKLNPSTNSFVTKLDIYGGAITNPVKLSIELHSLLEPLEVSTEICWFPLTYLNDVTLHNGNYTIGQNFKMMPGAKLTVAEDATLNITGKFIVYDQDAISSPASKYSYYDDQRPNHPTASNVQYGVTDPAVFTVNGTLTAATLGGKVHTNVAGATITITTATSLEAHEAKTYKVGDLKGLGYPDWITSVAASMGVGSTQEVDERYRIKKNAVLVGDGDIPATQATLGKWVAKQIVLDDYNGPETAPIEGLTFVLETNNEQKYAALPTPVLEDKVFLGWFIGDTQVKDGDTFPNTTPTLTAKWADGATITLDYNDGETANGYLTYAFASGEGGSKTYEGLPAEPTRTGYDFAGWWYNDTILVTSASTLGQTSTENHTLVARWTPKTYTITFDWVYTDFPEGEVPTIDGLQASISYNPDMANVTLSIPDVEYGFNGFFTARQENGTFATADKIYSGISGAELLAIAKRINGTADNETVGNIKIYGNWVPKIYAFIFDLGTNPYGLPAIDAMGSIAGYNPLDDTLLHNKVTTKDGVSATNQYYFAGWYIDSALTTPYDPNAELGDVDSITLYAKWALKTKVTVDYGTNDPNGFADSTLWVKPGTTNVDISANVAVNVKAQDDVLSTRYYFGGWCFTDGCTTSHSHQTVDFGTATEVTVYAQWIQKAKVTFSYGDDDLTDPTDTLWVIPGTTGLDIAITDYLSETTAKSKDDIATAQYYFNGWKIDANGTLNSTATKITSVNGNTVVSVNWGTKRTITVTSSKDRGSVSFTLTAEGDDTNYTATGTYYLKEGQTMTVDATGSGGGVTQDWLRIYCDGTKKAEAGNGGWWGTATTSTTYVAGASDGTIEVTYTKD